MPDASTPAPTAAASCPKCRRPARAGDAACARCGLLRARWDAFDGRPSPHPVLDPLWEHALLDWEDARRHQALAQVVTTDWTALSALSQRYSAVLRQRPGDAVAQAALDRLIQLALVLPVPARRSGPGVLSRMLRNALGLLVFAASLGVALALWRRF